MGTRPYRKSNEQLRQICRRTLLLIRTILKQVHTAVLWVLEVRDGTESVNYSEQ